MGRFSDYQRWRESIGVSELRKQILSFDNSAGKLPPVVKMMAHNLSAHALSSALNRRSSPYLSQDHMISSRHIPVLTVPDILESFHQSQPSSIANFCNNSVVRSASTHIDPWELPELKWLDPADNNVVGSGDNPAEVDRLVVQPLLHFVPEKLSLEGGEKWPFSQMYPGDQLAGNSNASSVDDSLTQFSMQSMVTASPASSGSSMLKRKYSGVTSPSAISNFAGRGFPSSAGSRPPELCTTPAVTPATCSSGPRKRSVPSDLPESHVTQETPISGRSTFKVGAQNFLPDRLISNGHVSPLPNISFPPEKRKRLQDGGVTATRETSPKGSVQKSISEKGKVSTTAIKEQAASPGRETSKKSPASVATASATATPTASDHEIHIWTERERRKKMNGMFTTLHSLLPHLSSKADKSTIVDEAINSIQSLEVTMKGMLKRKCERSTSPNAMVPSSLALLQGSKHGGSSMASAEMDKISPANLSLCGPNVSAVTGNDTGQSHKFQTLCSPNIVLNICGTDAFITICSPRGRSGLLCRVLFVMESHRLHVVNAHISTTDDTILFMLHAQCADQNEFSNPDMLNMTLLDLTNCLSSTPH